MFLKICEWRGKKCPHSWGALTERGAYNDDGADESVFNWYARVDTLLVWFDIFACRPTTALLAYSEREFASMVSNYNLFEEFIAGCTRKGTDALSADKRGRSTAGVC